MNHREPRVRDEQYVPQVDEHILEVFEADPTTSIRKTARQLNISIWKIWSVLNIHGKHAFHYTPVQELEECHPIRRIAFCRFLLNANIEDGLLLRIIYYYFFILIVLFILMSWRSSAIAAQPLNQDRRTQTNSQRPFHATLPSVAAETRTQDR